MIFIFTNTKRMVLSAILAILFNFNISAKDSITVYLFMLDECRICQEIAPEINKLYQEYQKEFTFYGVFPNFSSKQKNIDSFVKKHGIKFPTKTDYFKRLTKLFDATVLPEVVVYNETTEVILYRGAINDLFYAPGKRKHYVTNHYLSDALKHISDRKEIIIKETKPVGCFINFTDLTNI